MVRNLEVIGEAVKQLPGKLTQQYILIHHYFGIDVGIIWDVVKNKLSDFERQIRAILDGLAMASVGPGTAVC